jgi:hypothetical protein
MQTVIVNRAGVITALCNAAFYIRDAVTICINNRMRSRNTQAKQQREQGDKAAV